MAKAAADAAPAASDNENDEIQVTDLGNMTVAKAAADAPPAGSSTANDQIQVADLTNKSIASEAANAPPPTLPSSTSIVTPSTTTKPAQDRSKR